MLLIVTVVYRVGKARRKMRNGYITETSECTNGMGTCRDVMVRGSYFSIPPLEVPVRFPGLLMLLDRLLLARVAIVYEGIQHYD